MTNDLTTQPQSEGELIQVLQSSLYPGAAIDSIRMVLGYCKAAGLDPMLKPVHIVPMWSREQQAMVDVIMPGVGLYRTQASRSGQFAGMTEPEFGPDVTADIGGQMITYPEWCRVTVKRALSRGVIAEFTAREYWLENYAVKGGTDKSVAPNAMWKKRPRGQLAKCAAAQALRIAFPELGAQPTAEEMEGKTIDPAEPFPLLAPEPPKELLAAAQAAAKLGERTYAAFWHDAGKDKRKLLAGHHDALKLDAIAADKARTVEMTGNAPAGTQPPTDDPWVAELERAERGNAPERQA
jgi:phage recombination protein Bet